MAIRINNEIVIDDSKNFTGLNGTFEGNVGIGTSVPQAKIHVVGDVIIDGQFIPSTISAGSTIGTRGQVLQSTGVGVTWATPSSGEFNASITNTTQIYPLSYETTTFTFPSTSGKKYVIESVVASNVAEEENEMNIIASLNYNQNGNKVYFAYNIPVPSDSSIELLKQPHIANPSDFITMWSTNNNFLGISSAIEVYMTYTEISDPNYFGVGFSTSSIPLPGEVGIFTSTSAPSMIQSIRLVNRTDTGDYPVSIQITNGVSTSYLVKDLIIPRYASVEICDRPKRIEQNAIIKVGLAQTSSIDVSISGKKIIG